VRSADFLQRTKAVDTARQDASREDEQMNLAGETDHEAATQDRAGIAFGSLIFAAALVNALAFTALIPVLPAITAYFAATQGAAALTRGLVTVMSVALVFGAPVAGYTVERFGVRPVLLTAITIFTVAGVSGFVIDNLWLLLASRTLLGFADAFIGTLMVTLISARLTPLARDRWIGWFTAMGAIGALTFIPLSGAIAQLGWRYVFLLYGVGAVILMFAMLALRDEVSRPARAARPAASGPSLPRAIPFGLIALGIAAGAIENTTHLFLPFHLHALGESEPARIAQAVLPIALGGTLSAFLYGRLRTRFPIGSTFILAFLAGGAALIWIGFSQSYGMILMAAGCLGLGVGLLAPNVNAYAAVRGDPLHRARNIGFARGAFFAGAPIAQLLLEPVSAAAGAGMAIATLGAVSIALALAGYMIFHRRPVAQVSAPSP
jgi:MFS family permease